MNEKPCAACNGTGTVINMGVPEICGFCDGSGREEEFSLDRALGILAAHKSADKTNAR